MKGLSFVEVLGFVAGVGRKAPNVMGIWVVGVEIVPVRSRSVGAWGVSWICW